MLKKFKTIAPINDIILATKHVINSNVNEILLLDLGVVKFLK